MSLERASLFNRNRLSLLISVMKVSHLFSICPTCHGSSSGRLSADDLTSDSAHFVKFIFFSVLKFPSTHVSVSVSESQRYCVCFLMYTNLPLF